MKARRNELAPCVFFCEACPYSGRMIHFYMYECSECGEKVNV